MPVPGFPESAMSQEDMTAQFFPPDPLGQTADIFDQAATASRMLDEEKQRQDKMVRELWNEFSWYKTQREAYYNPVWDTCYRLYRLQIPDERQSGEWRSKLNVPYAFNNVEDVVPHLMEGVWGADRPFRIQATTDGGVIEAHEKLLMWEIREQMNLEQKWEAYQRQKAMYGTTAAYVGFKSVYRQTRRWKVPKDSLTQEPLAPIIEVKDIPEYVGPTFDVVDLYDLYAHPRATHDNIIKLFWVQRLTKAEMVKTGRFKNLDLVTDSMMESGLDESQAMERRYRTGQANSQGRPPMEKVFKLITCFDEITKKIVTFTYSGFVLLEESDYPFFHDKCPIVFDRYTEMPLEFYGVGVIEPAISLIHEGNAIRNQRRDNVNLIVNAMFEVREGDIDDEEDELVFQPGGLIHSRSGEALRPITMPMITGDSYKEEQIVVADINRTTGLGGAVSGQREQGVSSATGTSLLQKAQLLRLSRAISRETLAFKEVLSQMVALNVQFLPLPEVFAVLGAMHMQEYADMDQHSLVLRATIQVNPAGLYQNDDLMRQQLTNLLNILGSNPTFSQKINWDYMLAQILKAFNTEDVTQALKKPQGINVLQVMVAFHENQEMSTGAQIAPAQPGDDYDIHMDAHRTLLTLRPDLFQNVGQHMASHDQAQQMAQIQQQQQQMQALDAQSGGKANGPGSAPPGGQGGANPARQPQGAGSVGQAATISRMAPGQRPA